jgi:hypothetical protein
MSRYVNQYMVPLSVYDKAFYESEVEMPNCKDTPGRPLSLPMQMESEDYDFFRDYYRVEGFDSYEYYKVSIEMIEAWELYKNNLICHWYDDAAHENNIRALADAKSNGFNIYIASN